ncbi:hypothetical protein QQF64_001793, partial [Cirrhinus molitorella]
MTDLSLVGICRHSFSDGVWCLSALTPDVLNVTLHPQSITYNHNHGHNAGKTVKHTSQAHDDTSSFMSFSAFRMKSRCCFFFKAYFRQGVALQYLGRHADALAAFASGLAQDPKSLQLLVGMVEAAMKSPLRASPSGVKPDELAQRLPETSVFELQGILELLWMHSELQIWKSTRLSLGMV